MRASSLKLLPLVLCLLGFYSHQCYIESSRGQGVGFVEVPGASLNRTFSELARLERESKAPVWISETPNIVLAKFQAAYARSRRLLFLAKDYFRVKGMQRPFLEKQHFDLRNGETNPFLLDRRVRTALESRADTLVLASAVSQGVLNHRTESAVPYRTVVPMALEGIVNRLAFIESERGQTYSVKNRLLTSIYPAEDDLFFRGSKSNAVGRHLLFQVLNPSRPFRVVLGFTTVNKRGELRRIPPVAAVGSKRVPFAVAGYGSARVVSPPLSPQVIAGLPFIAVDLGVDGTSASEPRTRAMALYGADLPLDYRRTVGIAREISLISEEQYKAFTPPSTLHSFPKDLRHPDIEYSGIYEDGWVADSAFVRLASPADLRPFVMEGEIPSFETGFRTTLQVTIDG
ncbi:MAG: hypothetical protein HYZ57_04870, partial [Acidobacteria bacterium]|nr:hypothetical protein [Acidobacteriota bacterium]